VDRDASGAFLLSFGARSGGCPPVEEIADLVRKKKHLIDELVANTALWPGSTNQPQTELRLVPARCPVRAVPFDFRDGAIEVDPELTPIPARSVRFEICADEFWPVPAPANVVLAADVSEGIACG